MITGQATLQKSQVLYDFAALIFFKYEVFGWFLSTNHCSLLPAIFGFVSHSSS